MRVNRYLIPFVAALWVATLAAQTTAGTPASTSPAPAAAPGGGPGAPPADQADQSPPAAPSNGQQAGFAGQDTCVVCHEGFDAAVNRSAHGFVKNPRAPAAAQGCESCHGPGEAHTQDPENVKPLMFSRLSSDAVNDTCTTCHNRGEHALWAGSQHEGRNLSCTSCHSVHSPKSEHAQLKTASISATCATCHRDKANKLDRSGHMPVREGKLECTSCHDVHGSKNVRLLKTGFTINESCTSCHADKRGPFLWEHAPVRESCVTCHDPHGSSNERMLVAKVPFLCQRCHNHTRHPATIYDKAVLNTSNRIFSRGCATCHAQIHGSNHPSGNFLVR